MAEPNHEIGQVEINTVKPACNVTPSERNAFPLQIVSI